MARDWSTMPLDLLGAISMKLEICQDFICFSLVCLWWNRVASSIKNNWRATPTPWLLLAQNNKENPNCLRKIFNLKNNKCYELTLPETFDTRCWGSAYGWIVMMDRRWNVKLFNPISKAYIPFPSWEDDHNTVSYDSYSPRDRKREDYISYSLRCLVEKIVVLKASQSCRHEFIIVAFAVDCLAVARPGDQSWTLYLDTPEDYWGVDVLVMDDHVFVLYRDGRLVYWNAKEFFNLEFVKQIEYSPSQPHIFREDELNYTFNKVYLAQSGRELILVIRYKEEVLDGANLDYDIVYETYDFEVFKLNPMNKLWEKIEELPGVTLVVGCNSSMSVSSGEYLQESSIYFTDDECGFWNAPEEFGGHDMGVFYMKTGKISRFYEGDDMRSIVCVPTLFSPQL